MPEGDNKVRDYTDQAMDTAGSYGVRYADIRITRRTRQFLRVHNGVIEALEQETDEGFGIRVLLNGAWGFASSYWINMEEIDRVVDQAVRIAEASALLQRRPVELGAPVTSTGRYVTPHQVDPFGVSIEDKLAVLLAADEAMRKVRGVTISDGNMVFIREDKTFANTEGAFVEQTIIESGAGIEATAVAEGEIQRRSYPNTFARQQVTGGYEEIEAWALVEQAERIAEEAVELLSADVAPEGTFDIVLGPTQLALQVHESCGHPIELDRVFGTEAAYAGTSFLTPEKLGTFRYGSEVVNIVADATTPKGLGTFGWDDEGVPAQRVDIIKDGLFVGYLTSRESAMRLHELNPAAPAISNGTMRASAWNRIPLIRMTNINILPGSWEFDDLVADTDRGLYLEMNRSWSIDDRRLNFQFGTEIAREIKGGKLGKLYKNAVYTGITPEFWGRCDAVCNERHWSIWGTPNCGKGQPSQLAHVGHGAAPARFRGVRVFGVR